MTFSKIRVCFTAARFVLTALFLFGVLACTTPAPIFGTHPIQTETTEGVPIVQADPQRTMDRDNVPVGVNPDKVIAHFETGTGEEGWVVDQGLFHDAKVYIKAMPLPAQVPNPGIATPNSARIPTATPVKGQKGLLERLSASTEPAKRPEMPSTAIQRGLRVDLPERSKTWMLWVVLGVLILGGLWAVRRFVPVAGPVMDGIGKIAEPIIKEGTEDIAKAETGFFAWVKKLFGRK